MDAGDARIDIQAAVPVLRLRALLSLLYPTDMTPMAKRMFEQVIAETELAT